MEVNGKLHIPAILSWGETALITYWTGGQSHCGHSGRAKDS